MDDDFGDFAGAEGAGGAAAANSAAQPLSAGLALEGLLHDISSNWVPSAEHTRDHKTLEDSVLEVRTSTLYDEQEWGDFSVDENEAAAAKQRLEEEENARLEAEQRRLDARNAPIPLDCFMQEEELRQQGIAPRGPPRAMDKFFSGNGLLDSYRFGGDNSPSAAAGGSGSALAIDNLSATRHSLTKEIENLKISAISWWDTYCASHWDHNSLSQLPVSLLEYLASLHWVFFCEDILGSLSTIKVPKAFRKVTLLAAHEAVNRNLSSLKPLDEMDMAELLSFPKQNPECQLSGVSISVYKKFQIPVGTLDLGPVAVPFGNLYNFLERKKATT